ncbi:hypothetical protein B0J14DRAFT_603989 [Halenospora varia]|nr:hypothetical protein B0J14DRAFT_603989 [Halenospora varia]
MKKLMKSQDARRSTSTPEFRCSHSSCEKTFLRREHLTRHEQGHSPIKPHPCPLCPKAFARSDILNRHMALHINPNVSKRTQIACSNCRRRKIKCDANTPCATCISSQLKCGREEAEPQRQLPVTNSSPVSDSVSDAGSSGESVYVVDLNIDRFSIAAGGWCPTKSFRRR